MVISFPSRQQRRRGALMGELLVAISLLTVAILPIAYSMRTEREVARSYYEQALAMEIVDGEMEALVAGQWRQYAPGVHDYGVKANAAANLPEGKFLLTIRTNLVRLEWQPAEAHHGGPVIREVTIR
jgi:hypothetical protein